MTKEKNIPENGEMRVMNMPITVEKREEEGKTYFEGYAFKYDMLSREIFGFREKIAKGALKNIDLREDDIFASLNHNLDQLLARTISGTLELTDDDVGLKYRFEVPNTTAGRDLVVLSERGDIQHSSFVFLVSNDEWVEDDEYGAIRTITLFSGLYEVGPVANPAYLQSEAGVAQRSYQQFLDEKKKQEAPQVNKGAIAGRKRKLTNILRGGVTG